MAEPYTIVIGLEVHIQLLTKTKLFCGCRNQFGLPPNSATCPVCLGLPGALPVMNRTAFRLALRAALALNCQIARFTKWDRKQYYYPDLPKNYQISQYDLPFSHDGWLCINVHPDPKKGYTPKRIGIIRAHLEEDAGKLLHDESGRGGDSRVDLNRAGTPLLEIVTRPDMNTPEEAVATLEEIRLLMRELGVSDCEMQEGSLRCDANVNLHIPRPSEANGYAATPIVEIKNLNSFRAVGRAIRYEAARQYQVFLEDPEHYRMEKRRKTTAGWDDDRGRTEVQRHKEEAADYRYFPDPDLVPVTVAEELLAEIRHEMGELPSEQRQRLQQQYGLSPYDAELLTSKGRAMVAYFEGVAARLGDGKQACNRISDLIFPVLSEAAQSISEFPIPAAMFADFITATASLSKMDRLSLFTLMREEGIGIAAAMEKTGVKPAAVNEEVIRAAVHAAIANNPKAVADFKAGKHAAVNKIKGDVMKANKGVPNELVQRLLDQELAKLPGELPQRH